LDINDVDGVNSTVNGSGVPGSSSDSDSGVTASQSDATASDGSASGATVGQLALIGGCVAVVAVIIAIVAIIAVRSRTVSATPRRIGSHALLRTETMDAGVLYTEGRLPQSQDVATSPHLRETVKQGQEGDVFDI
jgi:hypothetical protein